MDQITLYKNRNKILYLVFCILFGVLFLGVLGENGFVLQKDSYAFIESYGNVKNSYFLYCSFLKICRTIFGESIYLDVVYVIQSILAFSVALYFTEYIRHYFNLNYKISFCIYVFSYLPYGYSLPADVVNHHIMTEAIAFPLFTLYMLYVFRVFLEHKKRHMIAVAVLTVLMVLNRSQMILLVPVYALLWIILLLQKIYVTLADKQRKFFWAMLTVVVIAGGTCGILLVGQMVRLSGNGQFADAVTGRILCAIDQEDRNLFSGEQQEIFDLLYEKVEENKHRYPYFRDGLWKWEDILNGTNENTKMYRKTILEYYREHNCETVIESTENSTSVITSELYFHHLDDYISMTLHLFLQSFVVAIFIHPTAIFALCYGIAVLLYAMAIVMLWYANSKVKVDIKYSIPLLLTMLLLIAIVVITNLIFFGQQRYVVYAFGCFYISLVLLGIGILRKKNIVK